MTYRSDRSAFAFGWFMFGILVCFILFHEVDKCDCSTEYAHGWYKGFGKAQEMVLYSIETGDIYEYEDIDNAFSIDSAKYYKVCHY